MKVGFLVVVGAIAGLLSGCSSTRPIPITAEPKPGTVFLTFEHMGVARNPLDVHMAEAGDAATSRLSGRDYWLRLHNESPDVISFKTFGMYTQRPTQWYELPDGRKVLPLADGMEVAIAFDVFDRKGRPIPYSAIDMFWTSHLPPARSVIFSVPQALLNRRQTVCVAFSRQGIPDEQRACYRNER